MNLALREIWNQISTFCPTRSRNLPPPPRFLKSRFEIWKLETPSKLRTRNPSRMVLPRLDRREEHISSVLPLPCFYASCYARCLAVSSCDCLPSPGFWYCPRRQLIRSHEWFRILAWWHRRLKRISKESYLDSDRMHYGNAIALFRRGCIVSFDTFPWRYVLHLCISSAAIFFAAFWKKRQWLTKPNRRVL